MPHWLRYVLPGLLGVICGVPTVQASSFSQDGSVVTRLHPAATVHQVGGVESTQIISPWKWHTKAALDFVFVSSDQKRVMQSVFATSLGFGLPLGLSLHLSLPLGWTTDAKIGNGETGGGVGDLRTGLLYQIKAAPRGGVGALLGILGYIPTGDSTKMLGDGHLAVEPFVSVSLSSFSTSLTLNLGYLFRCERYLSLQNGRRFEQDDDLIWRLALRIPKDEDIAWSLIVNGTIGVATQDGVWPKKNNRPVWFGGAIDFPGAADRRLGLFGSFLIGGADRGVRLGIQWSGIAKDRDEDRDGILLRHDQCPLLREDVDGFKDEDGCPDLDNDMDSFPDSEDACPLQKGGEFSMDGC
ncbi:MAG: transporter [Deltaproteobacteria bacterium]|nr:transporter [Deltaproteobacteria bacterium]